LNRARNKEANFSHQNKYELGLHPKGAVLLRPGISIHNQIFHGKLGGLIFMPIPLEKDHEVMLNLGKLDKMVRAREIYPEITAKVQHVRQRITRLHQAHTTDAFNKYYYVREPKGLDKGKIVYTNPSLDYETLRNNTTKYTRVELSEGNYREVIVKYRPHAGPFPLITDQTGIDGTSKYLEDIDYVKGPFLREIDNLGNCTQQTRNE
jgi:hypothetical protein